MKIGRAGALTDTGRRRSDNEDAFVFEPPLFAVADGMGGAQAGELASRIAVTTIQGDGDGLRGEEALRRLLQLANGRIFERAAAEPAAAGMGTTATVAVVDEAAGTLTLGHVGDSRAYRVRAGQLEQLTVDHSLVGELVRSGRITEAAALVHPARSVITRVLGTDATVEVDTLTVALAPGDLFVLCSDGLTTMLRDDTILRHVTEAGSPDEASEALVAAANAAGGEDNITVVAFEVVDGEPPERPALAPVAPTATTPAVPPAAAARRHGAGDGGRWMSLLLLAAIVLVCLLALWWGLNQ